MNTNRSKFTLKKMTEKFGEIMDKYTANVSTQVGLQLPKLKKIGNEPKKPAITLPKLKKKTEAKVGV